QVNELTQQDLTPVASYTHNIDSIQVDLDHYSADAVLVVNETAYPGWQVSVNGQAAKLESVGERLAIVLPEQGSAPTRVVFEYRPQLLYISALLSGLALLLFVGYALRIERFFPMVWRKTS